MLYVANSVIFDRKIISDRYVVSRCPWGSCPSEYGIVVYKNVSFNNEIIDVVIENGKFSYIGKLDKVDEDKYLAEIKSMLKKKIQYMKYLIIIIQI